MNLLRTAGYLVATAIVCVNVTLLLRIASPTCEGKSVNAAAPNAPPPVRLLDASAVPEVSASSEFLSQKGFELGNNHGSPRDCNELLFQFVRGTYASRAGAQSLAVLDVGGGKGALKELLGTAVGNPQAIEYKCIDVTASAACIAYGGERIKEASKSYDIVVFNYVLHHAGDSTIGLLQDAKEVARHYVVIQEDLKGRSQITEALMHEHEWAGTFRGTKEWTKIFSLLGMTVAYEAEPDSTCAGYYEVEHRLYVLKV